MQTISNEAFALVSSSMAYIETTARSGSGVLIESGYVLTNAEVVWPFETVDIVFPDGSEFLDVPVIGLDLQSDLAVLGPIASSAGGLKLVDGETTPKNSNVFVVGYPAKPEEFGQPSVESRLLLGIGRSERLALCICTPRRSCEGGRRRREPFQRVGACVGEG